MRPSPKINIGAVDLSCAFVLCDILRVNHPIVYISKAFERLTGYSKDETIGRNCRFLQGPGGKITVGVKQAFVDGETVYRLRSTIDKRSEIQAAIINYRKGGQQFMNLITIVPIQWDSEHEWDSSKKGGHLRRIDTTLLSRYKRRLSQFLGCCLDSGWNYGSTREKKYKRRDKVQN